MHLENLTFATYFTNPVTTLPDIQCQNSPTMTTFAKQTTPDQDITTIIDNQNYFTFQDEQQNYLYPEQPTQNWPTPPLYNNAQTCTENAWYNNCGGEQTPNEFPTELTEDQLNLERQFSSAFFNTIELDHQSYDDTSLLCDFEEPIDKNRVENSSPFYSDVKPSQSPASYSEISLSEFSPLNFMGSDTENLSDKDINFDIQNELSNSSFSFDLFSPAAEDGEVDLDETVEEKLPSICATFTGKNFGSMMKQEVTSHYSDINNFLRNSSATSIDMFSQQQNPRKNSYGHLLSAQPINNNLSEVESSSCLYENYPRDNNFTNFESTNCLSENQVILPQKDAILGSTDPFLSSAGPGTTNYVQYKNLDNFTLKFNKQLSEITSTENSQETAEETFEENDTISDDNDEYGPNSTSLRQCKWAECYKQFYGETLLVKHIEKLHVEVKRGDEFACFWENCPRKTKPFNARYKLLIHMRVHSGEKPNKCSWPRCNKAFSRLENLKIHQRSHTGERPYKCQHGGCHKAFSNSSDRAKHQRTHVDTKPYACQVANCLKRYTDPSSLRKHVKNHSLKEQAYVKRRQKNIQKVSENTTQNEEVPKTNYTPTSTVFNSETAVSETGDWKMTQRQNIRQDLKNKIMNDKVRKMQNEKVKNDEETFQNVVSSTTTKHFDNSEFIPYESVQRLFSDKIDYVTSNEIYDVLF